ncbi:acyl-CoA dehydrogenase family protein [Nocardia wallacei]|uniref:acyl-CoA dehydrogenase family protein n=1 Tax=Nocardia wallacei TaxID=480035 RepID=UPI0024580D15|nr:acyl-CoA dehydrogenase family protein [Nocardia wallacei]
MMNDFAEIHDELRTVARGLLAKSGHETTADWSAIAGAGWPGLEAPDEFDGAGATFAELAVVLEEIGRAAARTAFPSVAVLGVGALGLLAASPQRDRLLRECVAGDALPVAVLPGTWGPGTDTCAAVAGVGAGGRAGPVASAGFTLGAAADGLLCGTADFVCDATVGDRLLIPVRAADGAVVIAVVEAGAKGLAVEAEPVVDATRVFGRVVADRVAVAPEAVLRFAGDGAAGLRRLYDRAGTAIACDSLGLSAAVLDATVEYVRVREQFGRPVGSFQAVQHACADMLVQVSVARQLVTAAVRAEVARAPDASVAASMAKAYATEVAVRVAGKAMQLHGGIGYTWESGMHVYLKRATLNRSLFGTPSAHRAELARRFRRG